MHTRNRYQADFDYNRLVSGYPSLSQFIPINFKNPRALRELVYATLWVDFGLKLEIPLDSLIPPISSRLDYIHHIEDLLVLDGGENRGDVKGIDIGTGNSCIYPLLGCSLHPNWSFTALEINESSMEFATANVSRNGLDSRISILKNNGILNPEILTGSYDFCMCNPPFYSSLQEMEYLALIKERAPFAKLSGKGHELVTQGGEVAFILQMIRESIEFKARIKWFTTLVGKKGDLEVLENALDELVF